MNAHFEKLKAEARIANFLWESQEHAVSPYDFWYEQDSRKSFLDAKATSGGFERNIHISLPELIAMRDSAHTAKLRISKEMRNIATAVLKVLLTLPEGVSSDGVSISPSILEWENEQNLVMPDPAQPA